MKIKELKINHLVNPLGFDLSNPTLSYVVTEASGKVQKAARIIVSLSENFKEIVFDSGKRDDILSTGFLLPILLQPRTRYFWKVWAEDETGDACESAVAWFETAKDEKWSAKWITPVTPLEWQMAVYTDIEVKGRVKQARGYMTGLGVYEFYLNGVKQGEECLLPGFCDYDTWIQYQTFELELKEGQNEVELMLGDGWYKGWYGLRQKQENYGNRLAAIAEIYIQYEDGREEWFGTDASWKARKSPVTYSGIYPGEVFDATHDTREIFGTEELPLGTERLSPRMSPFITIHERLKPAEVIISPKGETILDMGQNMVGWIGFRCHAPAGTKIFLQMGEILQDGCFYNENLRTAKAEFTYISDGREREVRQHFTFYGFRYVKVNGWPGELNPNDFEGLVIHSDMEEISELKTENELVNQLIHNTKWGMKGNFLDIPTDCPQRDERYGWTGDAQIFSGTACFLMDTYGFYTKYGRDIYAEQKKLGGSVPDVVPVCNYPGNASTAWGDAATIIPWNVYLHYGDKRILWLQYESMKAWVDYMREQDEKDGGRRLWQTGFHYGDWLALDGSYPGGVYGATNPHFIASAYYFYSTNILAKTAKILEKEEDAKTYGDLARGIKEAFWKEYFTPTGNLAIDTMTAYTIVLYMGLVPQDAYQRVCEGLLRKLKRSRYHLETGFVGTPYLCRALSDNGMNHLAYHLLLEEGYPGWLYGVLMGATTIWERWNSVEPDGKISGTEMNSLNHYSYGSIVEWMYRNMAGICPLEEGAGYKKFRLAPMPYYRIGWVEATLHSASGLIKSSWKIKEKKLEFSFNVPFDSVAEIVLPDIEAETIREITNGMNGINDIKQIGKNTQILVCAGEYHFEYEPNMPYRKIYSVDSPFQELMENGTTRKILEKEYLSKVEHIPFKDELYTLEELMCGPFTHVSKEDMRKVDELLKMVEE